MVEDCRPSERSQVYRVLRFYSEKSLHVNGLVEDFPSSILGLVFVDSAYHIDPWCVLCFFFVWIPGLFASNI